MFFLITVITRAQTDTGTWAVYKNKLVLNEKTSFETQYQHRSFGLDLKEDQALLTAGLSYTIASGVSVSAGYRKIAALLENGAFQKIAIKTKLGHVSLINTFFIEEQWLDTKLQMRYRFGITANMPVTEKMSLSFTEEVFLQNRGTGFNQNRITAKATHKLLKNVELNTGIMHWQFPTVKRWVFILSLSHTIRLQG